MPPKKAVLVLHGLSMSGASTLRTLGPLAARLESLGFTLIAPNGGHQLNAEEMDGLRTYFEKRYGKVGQRAAEAFREGAFWDEDEHYDWFHALTDAETGTKTYRSVEESLTQIAAAIGGHDLVGVLGFSQGAAMAMILSALTLQGDKHFGSPAWGVFMSGFTPKFDEPKLFSYPIAGTFRALFVIGERDPVFPGNEDYLRSQAEAFADAETETLVIPGLSHIPPSRPEDVERIVRFVAA